MRRRHEKGKHSHYCLLVNKSARGYEQGHVRRLIEQIRRKGGYYSVFEPNSAAQLYHTAQRACGLRKWPGAPPQHFSRRGRVTSLVACGGDGTVNLAAKVALKADLPLGILPMGLLNNIARSLYGATDVESAIKKAMGRNYRKIDIAEVAGQIVVGSAGIGFAVQMAEILETRRPPRFCLGWSQLGSKAAAEVRTRKMMVRIDAFRFEATPIILNFNLLPCSFGLPLSPVSVDDDGTAEVIFNLGVDAEPFSTFARQICRRKYVYGFGVKLFRGKEVSIEPVKGMTLYCDGDLVDISGSSIDFTIPAAKLKVFC